MSFLQSLFGNQAEKINVVELKEKMDAKTPNVLYLDVRSTREFSSGKIKGFKNIPVNEIPGRLSEIPKNKEIVVICQSGSRSSSAARFLKKNDYENVLNVSGGMGSWSMHRF